MRRNHRALPALLLVTGLVACNEPHDRTGPRTSSPPGSVRAPSKWLVGCRLPISLRLDNRTGQAWEPEKSQIVFLWRKCEGGGGLLPESKPLPEVLAPGAAVEMETVVTAPPTPGCYHLGVGVRGRSGGWLTTTPRLDQTTISIFPAALGAASERTPATSIRLIGMDGATWNLLLPWIEAGRLPAMASVLRSGCWGRLESLPGSLSPVMWTSIATGFRAEQHGVHGYQKRDGYQMRLVSSTDRKKPAFWNIATAHGRTSFVVNWMITYPAEAIRGVMVSGVRELDVAGVHPPDLREPLERVLSQTEQPPGLAAADDLDKWRHYLLGDVDRLIAIERFLRARGRPDLAAYYTHSTDEAQHRFWRFMQPEAFADPFFRSPPEVIAKHRDAIFEVYSKLDDWIGESWDPSVEILVLVSDHGARAATRPRVYLAVDKLVSALGFARLSASGKLVEAESRAFDCTENPWSLRATVCINLEGSERRGVVAAADLPVVARELARGLASLELENGEALLEKVTVAGDSKSIEVEPIPLTGERLDDGLRIGAKTASLRDYLVIHDISGDHDRDGILAIAGGPLRAGGPILGANLLDVAPTILYLLGLPLAADLEGQPLTELVDAEHLLRNPVRRETSPDSPPNPNVGTAGLASNQPTPAQQELRDRLRSLGYIQ